MRLLWDDRAWEDYLYWQSQDKRTLKKINALSSHADKKEIISWLIKIDTSKLKTIFLVHGEPAAQEELKHQIERKFGIPVKIVKNNKKYYLK